MSDDCRQRLMRGVARRQLAAAIAVNCRRCILGAAAAGGAWLAGSRLLGLWPEGNISGGTAAAIGVLLFVGAVGMGLWRKPAAAATARVIDSGAKSQDLFLTAEIAARSPGEYRALVLRQAEEKAAAIKAANVLPLPWQAGAVRIAVALALFALGAAFLPRLDPFGKSRQRREIAQRQERLDQSRQATATRVLALEQQAGEAPKVERAIAALEQTFQKARPAEKEANFQRLAEHQKELGQLWRQVGDAQLKKALEPSRVEQSFGRGDPQQTERWKEALRKGDASGLKKELSDLQDRLKRLAALPDSAQKRSLQDQVQRQLGALADSASKAAQSTNLNAALSRALDQLGQGRAPQLSAGALQAAAESLGLSVRELEALERSMREFNSLEDALKGAQLAKQLNEQGALDGQDAAGCKSMEDYADLYARSLARKGGNGRGMGPNPGLGRGGHAPENGSAKTAYQPEKSPTTLWEGKLLMQWKTSEVSEPGQTRQDYLAALQQVRQGVSEAIVQEQAPPGYHQAIQKYFDALAPAPAAGK